MHDPHDQQPQEWLQRLGALVAQRMQTPFAWGSHDCCLWAADCVHAQTGNDPAASYRGTYATAAEAMVLVRSLGGMDAIGAMGGQEIPPLGAGQGDIGLVQDEGGREVLAVCLGLHWLAPAATGLAALPLDSAVKAWGVDRG